MKKILIIFILTMVAANMFADETDVLTAKRKIQVSNLLENDATVLLLAEIDRLNEVIENKDIEISELKTKISEPVSLNEITVTVNVSEQLSGNTLQSIDSILQDFPNTFDKELGYNELESMYNGMRVQLNLLIGKQRF